MTAEVEGEREDRKTGERSIGGLHGKVPLKLAFVTIGTILFQMVSLTAIISGPQMDSGNTNRLNTTTFL
jgi:hypothetical protein